MQDRVLDSTRVLVDRHPVIGELGIKRLAVVVGAGVTQEVPRRVYERVHGVRLPASGAVAFRTRRLPERLHLRKGPVLVRQLDRQLIDRHRHHAVVGAIDDRDGRSPVALAGDQPIAESVLDRPLADALRLQPVADAIKGDR